MTAQSIQIVRAQNISAVSKRIVRIHHEYFIQRLGWGDEFETEVKKYLQELEHKFQSDREGLWVAKENNKIIGSIAIDDREIEPECARLRIFVVDYNHRHQGAGRALLNEVIQHCRKTSYKKIVLWTFETLDKARSLYIKNGFKLIEERDVSCWGHELREQLFSLELS